MQDVVAVVLNYRNCEETLHCIETLRRQDYPCLEILVVDNASPDNSYDLLMQVFREDPKVNVIRSESNKGYAAGNNHGVRCAKARSDPKYILIANPDVEFVEADTVSKLVSCAEVTEDAAVVGPKIILPDGFIQGPSGRPNLALIALQYLFLPFWAVVRWRAQRASRALREPQRVFRTVGACMLLVADDFCRAGMFDEGTFLEGEEDILAERLAAIGKYFYFYPLTSVIHHHSRRNYKHTRAAQKYYFLKYRHKSRIAISCLILSSMFYEYVSYPVVRLIRAYGRSNSDLA